MNRALGLMLLSLSAVAAERPRLGVVLIVDQLSSEVYQARASREKAGFKRLRDEGLVFREAAYDSAPTVTAAGHATLATGTYPDVHGIVANEWIDGETGRSVYSAEDASYQILGRTPGARDCTAPTLMKATTLSDAVRSSDDKAKAVVISAKDRSAIATGGTAASAVVWFDNDKPFFTTSTFYAKTLPEWLKPVNDGIAQMILKGAFTWGLPGGGITGKSPKLPAKNEEPPIEAAGIQAALEHAEVDLAEAAIVHFELGKDEIPDLLTVSFSGHDRIGHRYGPDAPEALAEYDALDREIGRLLEILDKRVGAGQYTVVLSADHGVAPLPELMKARGLDSGRVESKVLMAALEKLADDSLGANDWFIGTKVPGLNANPKNREKLLTIFPQLKAAALKQPGVLDFYATEQLLNKGAPDSVQSHYLKGITPGRSPDFLVVTRPYWIFGSSDTTGHASAYHYDAAVPLVWFGKGVTHGTAGRAEPIDLAPTMAALMGVPPPASSRGHVLEAVVH